LTNERVPPDGSSCVLDTNALLYANQGASARAVDILRRCAALEITGHVPATVWEELCHRLMVIEAVATGRISGPNPARKLAEKPEIVRELREYRNVLARLAAMRLRYEPILQRDILPAAIDIQRRYGLLTNDSIIAACALRAGVEFIVSSDSCFDAVPGVRLVHLDDIQPLS